MALKYFKMRWPDHTVPTGEPTWLFYEVDSMTDDVLRMIELFEDGSCRRNSLALESQKGPPIVSLVSISFTESIADHNVELVPAETFDELHAKAIDRAY